MGADHGIFEDRLKREARAAEKDEPGNEEEGKADSMIHEDAIDAWGGTHGIRDRGLLESAVGAAMNLALYDPAADLYDVAAAYAYHVAQNQPFLDGNKRAGSGPRQDRQHAGV